MTLNIETTKIHGHTVHNTSSIEGFRSWIQQVKDKTETTIYRGQRKDFPLLPNICRDNKKELLLQNEKKLLTEFKNKAKPYLQAIPKNDWEWLVFAQHHGLYTRLIDWSYDPYVALWFALKETEKNDNRPEVWVMNPLKKDVISNFDKTRPFSGQRSKVFNSSFRFPRINEQKGCFILFKHIENTKNGFVPIENNKQLRTRINRIRIQNHSATHILSQLNDMGYDNDSMFPNIDKVAELVQQKVLQKDD
jgi:hypothetical protein